jgi:hypothetical protein
MPVKSQKAKTRSPMRDIKPKTLPRDVFTIHQLKGEGEGLSVDPLVEDNSEPGIEIHKIEPEGSYTPGVPPKMNVTPVEEEPEEDFEVPDIEELIPKETIKVKFGKFVQLVQNHDFVDVIEAHAEDEIIMTSNLLTDLAGAHDKREEKKIPLVFLIGIVIGVVLTYIFFSQ